MKRFLLVCFSLSLAIFLVACRNSQTPSQGGSNQSMSIIQEEVILISPNGQIWGQVYRPDDDGKHPILIYSHGLGSSYSYGVDYGDTLAKQGYVVYTFDFYGGSYSGRSGGAMSDMTVFTEVADLNAVVNHFKKVDYVDTDNIFLIGASQGGVVSSLVASQRGDIGGLILNFPAFVLKDEMSRRFATVQDIPETFNLMGMTMGHDYAASVLNYDLMTEATQYQGPVLILHGTADKTAPISYSQEAVKRFKNAHLISLDGVGHSFSGVNLDRALEETQTFMNDNRIKK